MRARLKQLYRQPDGIAVAERVEVDLQLLLAVAENACPVKRRLCATRPGGAGGDCQAAQQHGSDCEHLQAKACTRVVFLSTPRLRYTA